MAVAAGWVAAAVLGGLAWRTDPLGQILVGVAAAILAVQAARETLFRPALSAGPTGLTVIDGWRRLRLAWPDIVAVRAIRVGHLTRTHAVEIETPDRVIVLAGYRVGGNPAEVVIGVESAMETWLGGTTDERPRDA